MARPFQRGRGLPQCAEAGTRSRPGLHTCARAEGGTLLSPTTTVHAHPRRHLAVITGAACAISAGRGEALRPLRSLYSSLWATHQCGLPPGVCALGGEVAHFLGTLVVSQAPHGSENRMVELRKGRIRSDRDRLVCHIESLTEAQVFRQPTAAKSPGAPKQDPGMAPATQRKRGRRSVAPSLGRT